MSHLEKIIRIYDDRLRDIQMALDFLAKIIKDGDNRRELSERN